MKVRIKRGELMVGLQRVQGVVERRTTLPILANVLLRAEAGGLTLYATDLEMGVQGTYEAEVLEDGVVTLSARKLYEIVRELPDGDVVLAATDRSWATLEAGRSHFRLAALPEEEFPAVPSIEQELHITADQKGFEALIRKTIFAAGESDSRYMLNGILFELSAARGERHRLRLVGTDGHRMALAELSVEASSTQETSVVVAKKAVVEMRRLLEDKDGQTSLTIGKGHMVFQKGRVRLMARLMEGTYPNYQQVIPKESDRRLVADRRTLEAALKRAALLSREKTSAVRLHIEPQRLELTSSTPDVGEAREEIPVRYTGEAMTTGFNARYLLDVLGVLESDEVVLEIHDPLSPCVIRSPDDKSYCCVVMPMRV